MRSMFPVVVLLPAVSATCTYTVDTNRHVSFENWRAVSAHSKEECCTLCADDTGCEFSTFHSLVNLCRLKSGESTGTFSEKGTYTCDQSATANLVQLAEADKDLSTLVSAVVAGDLADTLSSPGPFTLFAPTNAAFAALPAGTLDNLMKPANKAQLVDILTTHVLPVEAKSTDLKSVQLVASVQGRDLVIKKDAHGVTVSTDGKDIKKVTNADNIASNGVAHIIDGVLLPPAAPIPNIVKLAESVADLSTLVAAVVAGDLADTLSSPGPFTLFAPTNEAFAALPAGTLDNLMKPENKGQLVDILTYHVLPVQAFVADLKLFQPTKTVEGKLLHITKWGDVVKVGPSLLSKDLHTVTGPDNFATNGVAHIIDGVLLPPATAVVV